MSNYAWLCEYDNSAVANTYGIVVQTDDFDRSEILFLQDRKKYNEISDEERDWKSWKGQTVILTVFGTNAIA